VRRLRERAPVLKPTRGEVTGRRDQYLKQGLLKQGFSRGGNDKQEKFEDHGVGKGLHRSRKICSNLSEEAILDVHLSNSIGDIID
jgi:hypothetical protein